MDSPKITKSLLTKYQKFFSESKFWETLKKLAIRLGEQTLYYVLILYYTLKSPDVSDENKKIIKGALVYLILPFDFVPDFIPVAGLLDDAAAIKLAYETIKASVTPEIEQQAKDKIAEWFPENQ